MIWIKNILYYKFINLVVRFFITDKGLIDKIVFVFNPNLVMVMINVDKVRKK